MNFQSLPVGTMFYLRDTYLGLSGYVPARKEQLGDGSKYPFPSLYGPELIYAEITASDGPSSFSTELVYFGTFQGMPVYGVKN